MTPPYPAEGPCPECGAMVGHRFIPLEKAGEDGTSWQTGGSRACSLGGDVVPRAEHERVKAALVEERACHARHEEEFRLVAEQVKRFKAYHEASLREERDYSASLREERDAMLANLTSTKARCTELLEEVRALKAELV